jgi:hypothetical protein
LNRKIFIFINPECMSHLIDSARNQRYIIKNSDGFDAKISQKWRHGMTSLLDCLRDTERVLGWPVIVLGNRADGDG